MSETNVKFKTSSLTETQEHERNQLIDKQNNLNIKYKTFSKFH